VIASRLTRAAKGTFTAIEIVPAIIALLFLLSPADAQDQEPQTAADVVNEQIQIEADKLATNDAEKYAEFSGNVRASQGELTILSDNLRIYYRDDLKRTENQSGSQRLINRVAASGNVRLTTDKYTAEANRLKYDLDTMVLVLDGKNSTVKSGKNTLTGSKITIDRKDGQMTVDGSPQNRVKAVFYPEEKGPQKEP
jgi:lipopolysaccharide export system protein LptA